MIETGMSETDTRRHYYREIKPGYYARVCGGKAPKTPVVIMPGISADCKKCEAQYRAAFNNV